MQITTENILLVGSFLLFMAIIAGKTSYRYGVPTLLMFLGMGMLAGTEGLLGIHFDNAKTAQFIGIVSLNFILFSGGLDTGWSSVRKVWKQGLMLSTFGVLLTAVMLGGFVWLITDFTIFESLLLGSIVSSTDAAAVFSILRSKNMALKYNLRHTLELESGSNDPMAYVLTITFLGLVLNPEQSALSVIGFFLHQMVLGGIMGLGFGFLSRWIINHIRLDFEGLYPVLVIALMFIAFSTTEFFGGNGFLSIYIMAVYLGNQEIIHKKSILKMFDGLAWLMQIVLFLTLGLLVFPSQIVPYIGIGLFSALFLIFAARPIGVFLSLAPMKISAKKSAYISWVGLRGAVPIVFATYPLLSGISQAHAIFNIVFFISVTSVVIQGTTLSPVARLFRVALPSRVKPISQVDKLISDLPKSTLREFTVAPGSRAEKKRIVDLKFPSSAFIIMIKRDGDFIRPGGSTSIDAGDELMVLADRESDFDDVETCLNG